MSKARDRKYKEYRERQEDARVRAEAKTALQSLATYEQMVNPAKVNSPRKSAPCAKRPLPNLPSRTLK